MTDTTASIIRSLRAKIEGHEKTIGALDRMANDQASEIREKDLRIQQLETLAEDQARNMKRIAEERDAYAEALAAAGRHIQTVADGYRGEATQATQKSRDSMSLATTIRLLLLKWE